MLLQDLNELFRGITAVNGVKNETQLYEHFMNVRQAFIQWWPEGHAPARGAKGAVLHSTELVL